MASSEEELTTAILGFSRSASLSPSARHWDLLTAVLAPRLRSWTISEELLFCRGRLGEAEGGRGSCTLAAHHQADADGAGGQDHRADSHQGEQVDRHDAFSQKHAGDRGAGD